MWYRVDLKYACFSIIVEEGVCTEAAPIGHWMKGKSIHTIKRWVIGKHGSLLSFPGKVFRIPSRKRYRDFPCRRGHQWGDFQKSAY